MIPSFSLQLENDILPKLVTIGKYDGKTAQLTCGTSSGKIFLHNPKDNEKPIKFLSIHRDVKCLTSGKFQYNNKSNSSSSSSKKKKEVLFIGTENHLLCYDVEKNSDIFYLEIDDGVEKLLFSSFKKSSSSSSEKKNNNMNNIENESIEDENKNNNNNDDNDENNEEIYKGGGGGGIGEDPLIFVGGNCSLRGYDNRANDVYWNTPGGKVTELMIHNEKLYVATDDFNMYVYNSEELMVKEIYGTNLITNLVSFGGGEKKGCFGFTLVDGTFGVYDQEDSLIWKDKSKYKIVSMNCFDFNQDGKMEMILGYENGLIEIRRVFPSPKSSAKGGSPSIIEGSKKGMKKSSNFNFGEVLYKDRVSKDSITSILVYDYKNIGQEQIIVCTSKGAVKGYLPKQIKSYILSTKSVEDEIEQLKLEKAKLNDEIRNFEENFQRMKYGNTFGNNDHSLIPTKTQVKCRLKPNPEKRSVDIIFESNQNTFIKMAIIEGDNLFQKEKRRLFYVDKDDQKGCISVGLRPVRDVEVKLFAKVLVGSSILSESFHVFELSYKMPRFSMYVPIRYYPPNGEPTSHVDFKVQVRSTSRIVQWFNSSFNIVFTKKNSINVKFACLRDQHCLRLELKDDGRMRISTDNITLAGDLIQDLSSKLGLENLESHSVFPKVQKELQQLLFIISELNKNRNAMSTEMADTAFIVKNLVIKAEDCRVNVMDMKEMRRNLTQLMDLNKDLINEYKKRSNNQSRLIQGLKRINWLIQQSSRLRVGSFKKKMVSQSRMAIKKNNIQSLLKIFEFGSVDK